MPPPKVLLLDNRDSFVWNLAQAFEVLGCCVAVQRSDAVSMKQIHAHAPDALVLSPGPGRPADAGICLTAVAQLSGSLPILGVCLGHQVVAECFGAAVDRGPPRHGKTSEIHHGGTGLFRGLPNPLAACRYHSLVVAPHTVPGELRVTARTTDGVIMALAHVAAPTFGVQFHPESFLSEHGGELLRNFLERPTCPSQQSP
ncbi:MAG: aminodeoxychorismate/anthranilate synthase component II [Planctomycetota bacterium]